MGLISLLIDDPKMFAVLVPLLLYSVIFHEVAHGAVAYLFGDDTALRYGRLTLNPLPHLDPVGALLLFLVGFGWARPVPVNYRRLKHSRAGLVAVALAGCVTNIFIAILGLSLLRLDAIRSQPVLADVLPVVVKINIILAAFNLIPIPPLDGSKILLGFLPAKAEPLFARLEPFGFGILLLLLVTRLLDPVIGVMQRLITGLIAALFHFFR